MLMLWLCVYINMVYIYEKCMYIYANEYNCFIKRVFVVYFPPISSIHIRMGPIEIQIGGLECLSTCTYSIYKYSMLVARICAMLLMLYLVPQCTPIDNYAYICCSI